MYLKVARGIEKLDAGSSTEIISDDAVGVTVVFSKQETNIEIGVRLIGPCSLTQVRAVLSALLQTSLEFETTIFDQSYRTLIAIDETVLSDESSVIPSTTKKQSPRSNIL